MYKKNKGNIKQLNSELKMIICKRIQKFLLYKKKCTNGCIRIYFLILKITVLRIKLIGFKMTKSTLTSNYIKSPCRIKAA